MFLFAELMFVICWMLHPEVEFRAKLADIINYPWFTRHVNINDYNYDSVLGKKSFCVCVFVFLKVHIIERNRGKIIFVVDGLDQ